MNMTRPRGGESLLRHCVETLAFGIGERCRHRLEALEAAARFAETQLTAAGLRPVRQTFVADGRPYHIVSAELSGASEAAGTLVVAAHTDAAMAFPPAGDDVFGAAALLGLARSMSGRCNAVHGLDATIRFVACIDLEWTDRSEAGTRLGSRLYARQCRLRGDDIRCMLSVQGLGAGALVATGGKEREEGGKRERARALTFVGEASSWRQARSFAQLFKATTGLSASWSMPSLFYPALRNSDHLAFAREGFPALAVTTGNALLPTSSRSFHHVDYGTLAMNVWGLETTLAAMALN